MCESHKLVFQKPVKIDSRACKFGPFLARQKLHTDNMSLCKSTLWQQVVLYIESWIRPVCLELRGQSSIAIKTLPLGFTWSADENKMSSNHFRRQPEPSEIHLYNSFIHIFIFIIYFSTICSLKTKLLYCCVHVRLILKTVLYAGRYLFIVSCSNRGNRIWF